MKVARSLLLLADTMVSSLTLDDVSVLTVAGWSYGFDGRLAKAPKYQEMPSFNKDENSLYKVHVHTDKLGFVWVNLEASETPTIAWNDDFLSVDEQPRFSKLNMDNYHYDHSWDMIGEYNWKTLADNYNEASDELSFAGNSSNAITVLSLPYGTSRSSGRYRLEQILGRNGWVPYSTLCSGLARSRGLRKLQHIHVPERFDDSLVSRIFVTLPSVQATNTSY